MAGVTEGVTIDGLIRTQAVLNDLLKRTEDLSPLMDQFGAYGEESTVHRFETQKGPDGKTWDKSERAKAGKGKGQTLVDTARLRQSVTWRADAKSAEWGTNVAYAAAHQFGMDEVVQVTEHNRLIRKAFGRDLAFPVWQTVGAFSRQSNLPARPYLGIDGDDEDEIDAILHDYIAAAIQ